MLYKVFKRRAILVFTIFLLFSSYSQAQFKKRSSSITGQKFKLRSGKAMKKRNKPINYINSIDLSLGLGASTYYGELCSGISCGLKNLLPSVHLGVYYRWSAHFSVRGEFGYVPLRGTDTGGKHEEIRGLKFQNNGFDATAMVIYDIIAFRKMYRQRSLINPYVGLGVGVYYYDPFARYNGNKYDLSNYRTEESKDVGKYAFTIPISIGIRVPITPFIEIAGEARFTPTFTDYIDDVSSIYPETNVEDMSYIETVLSDPASTRDPNRETRVGKGSPRGNPDTNDGYINFEVKVIYTFRVTQQRYNINSNRSRFRMVNGVKKRR